jgi:hypothetical protein
MLCSIFNLIFFNSDDVENPRIDHTTSLFYSETHLADGQVSAKKACAESVSVKQTACDIL